MTFFEEFVIVHSSGQGFSDPIFSVTFTKKGSLECQGTFKKKSTEI